MEYTKGEWEAEVIGNEGKCVIHTGDLSLPFAHTFPNRYRRPQISSEEALANAHLIAAAPELYEALKALVLVTRRVSYTQNEIAHANQALAKAGGK